MLNTTMTRAIMLMGMHDAMIHIGDEELYMTWITLAVPDEPTAEDFYSIAENEKFYNECVDLFHRLEKEDEENNY